MAANQLWWLNEKWRVGFGSTRSGERDAEARLEQQRLFVFGLVPQKMIDSLISMNLDATYLNIYYAVGLPGCFEGRETPCF